MGEFKESDINSKGWYLKQAKDPFIRLVKKSKPTKAKKPRKPRKHVEPIRTLTAEQEKAYQEILKTMERFDEDKWDGIRFKIDAGVLSPVWKYKRSTRVLTK